MAIFTEHQTFVVPGSVKSSAVGGVEFVIRCCGKHEKSVHIQHPGRHSQDELLRIRDQHLLDVAQEHENHEAAVAFLAQNANLTTGDPEARRTGGAGGYGSEAGDCGCGDPGSKP